MLSHYLTIEYKNIGIQEIIVKFAKSIYNYNYNYENKDVSDSKQRSLLPPVQLLQRWSGKQSQKRGPPPNPLRRRRQTANAAQDLQPLQLQETTQQNQLQQHVPRTDPRGEAAQQDVQQVQLQQDAS